MWHNTITNQKTDKLPKNHTDGMNLYSLTVSKLHALGWEEKPLPPCDDAIEYRAGFDVLKKTKQMLDAELESKWRNVRNQRDRLLMETDWTQLADSTVAEDYITYRAALRDITDIYTSPDAVIWPTLPR